MDLDSITPSDFKSLFVRDFSYLPVWSDEATYNTGDQVYYESTDLFYQCKNNGVTSLPTVTADWDVISDNILNYVLDADITRAFDETKINFNQSLFGTDEQIQLGYLYLTAHYMVMDLQAAQEGLNSSGKFMVASRSVGSVSESYSVPQRYLDDPYLSYFTQTRYGQKYLSLLQAAVVGNVVSVGGGTRP